MTITPFILGSGLSSRAIRYALAIAQQRSKGEITVRDAIQVERSGNFPVDPIKTENPILFLGNPHALHAPWILRAAGLGFIGVVAEKPAAVDLQQIQSLKSVTLPVAVLHGYRMMWGPQEIRRRVDSKEFGKVLFSDLRYLQSSIAEAAVTKAPVRSSWKNDATISGNYDVTLDIGTHAFDLLSFINGGYPSTVNAERSFAHAPAPHRDTQIIFDMKYDNGARARGFSSKIAHGFNNKMELNVFMENGSLTWDMDRPDELQIGRGNQRQTIIRTDTDRGSGHPAFHGMGWQEGYTEIISSFLKSFAEGTKTGGLKPKLKSETSPGALAKEPLLVTNLSGPYPELKQVLIGLELYLKSVFETGTSVGGRL